MTNHLDDFPSLEELRMDLITTAKDRPVPARSRRLARRGLVMLALLLLPAGAAVATISQLQDDENVKWVSAAKGTDPNFGRWEIFRDGTGADCFGISMPDQDPPGVARAIAGSCFGDSRLYAGFINSRDDGLFAYGVAADEADSVTLSGPGRAPLQGRLFNGPPGAKFFVVSNPDPVPRAEITALDGSGRPIGTQIAPE